MIVVNLGKESDGSVDLKGILLLLGGGRLHLAGPLGVHGPLLVPLPIARVLGDLEDLLLLALNPVDRVALGAVWKELTSDAAALSLGYTSGW